MILVATDYLLGANRSFGFLSTHTATVHSAPFRASGGVAQGKSKRL